MDDEPRTSRPPAQPHRGGELGALAQPGRGRKHWNLAIPGDVRPRGPDGPSDDGQRGWRDRRACACAAESRGSWRADGCSAGTCACSQLLPPAVQGSFTYLRHAQATLEGRACQGTGAREARSNGRTVKSQSLPRGQDDTPVWRQTMWASGCSGGASAVSVPAPAFPDRPLCGRCPRGNVGLRLA